MTLDSSLFHVIITRFNLPSGGRESRIRHADNWLADRFDLFEQVCLPAVASQTKLDFLWFLYFDENTPEPFKTRAMRYQKEYSFIRIFWETRLPLPKIQQQLIACAPNSATRLLSTRLDNDDAVHVDFVAKLQSAASNLTSTTARSVLNFPNGYTMGNRGVYSHRDESNAFTSLLEPLDSNLKCIRACQHTELHTLGKVHQLGETPMWIQVIHGRNVSNRVRGRRITGLELRKGFSYLEDRIPQTHEFLVALDNAFLYPIRMVKEWGRQLIKAYIFKRR